MDILDGESKGEVVDRLIDRFGFTVSDSEGNDVKLSKYLRLFGSKGNGRKVNRGARELRKLAWDMNDGTMGDLEEKLKR